MNPFADELRRKHNSVPVILIYIRLGLGGMVFTQYQDDALGIVLGETMGYYGGATFPVDYNLPFDERDDVLIYYKNRLEKIHDLVLAKGIQTNSGLRKANTSGKKVTGKIVLNNNDLSLSDWWSNEPFLGREAFCKLGFVGLPYIYYQEFFRGSIISVSFSKRKINLKLEG